MWCGRLWSKEKRGHASCQSIPSAPPLTAILVGSKGVRIGTFSQTQQDHCHLRRAVVGLRHAWAMQQGIWLSCEFAFGGVFGWKQIREYRRSFPRAFSNKRLPARRTDFHPPELSSSRFDSNLSKMGFAFSHPGISYSCSNKQSKDTLATMALL